MLNVITKENFTLNDLFLFDPHYNYYPINKNSQLVNINYMLKNKFEFSNFKMLDSDNIKLNMLENNKRIFITNRIPKEYSILGKISLNIVRFIPKNLMIIYKFGIFISPTLDNDYKEFLYARLDHILLDYEQAEINYSNITSQNNYYDNANYWYERIKSSESKLNNYEDILLTLVK